MYRATGLGGSKHILSANRQSVCHERAASPGLALLSWP
jgi:hypothetical protein